MHLDEPIECASGGDPLLLYKMLTDTLKDSSMLGSMQHVVGACLKISVPSKL